MKPLSLFFIAALFFVLINTACISQPPKTAMTIQPTIVITALPPMAAVTTVQTTPGKNDSASIAKLDPSLARLINRSGVPAGTTTDEIRTSMQNLGQLVPAGEAPAKFSLTGTADRPVGDQVHVTIQLKTYSSTIAIDSYVTQVTSRDEAFHTAVAWVDVNRLRDLAAIDDVRSISLFIPPVPTQPADITVIRGHSFGTDMTL
jgi:hypothetical protein